LPKYITEYVKEHYDVVKVRKEVAEKLREFAKEMGLTINDAIAYLLLDMQKSASNVVDQIISDVADYVLSEYGKEPEKKLLLYPGGDYRIFNELNRIFMAAKADVFVEVFAGSAWCSMNVSRSKFKVIVCNDIDEDLINFYKMVKERPYDLVKRLAILPYSRELYEIAIEALRDKSLDPLTRAALFFYVVRTSFFGMLGGGFRISKIRNEARTYTNAVALIPEFSKRFKDVTLECKDFREVIKSYDSEKTLFYLDPPYVGKGREDYYRHGFTVADLKDLARLLKSVRGYWVLKIVRDNYELIENELPPHELEEIRTPLHMKKVIEEKRPEFKYLVAYNFKAPRTAPLFR